MIVFPAIDLLGGQCVRLEKGAEDRTQVYDSDPIRMAVSLQSRGAEWLHVVDLDAAFGRPLIHRTILPKLLAAVSIPVQVGGGLRSIADLEQIFAAGARRAIIGSMAVEQPELLREAVARWGDRIAVGLDMRGKEIATRGWRETAPEDLFSTLRRLESAQVCRIIHTQIERDGTLTGPAIEATLEIAGASGMKVIASGGVGSLEDLLAAKIQARGRLEGVIIGKALYENRFTLEQALAVFSNSGRDV